MAKSNGGRRGWAWAVLILGIFVSCGWGLASGSETGPPFAPSQEQELPPKWVQEDWAYYTQGTGQWVTDNSKYKSSNETWDAYRLDWKWGLGKKTLRGRMVVIKDGKEIGAIWEFLSYWHPKEQRLVVNQWGGDGTFGTGDMVATADNKTESDMQFFNPDGTTVRIGHRTDRRDGEFQTDSFNIRESGTWEARRQYVWKLVR